MSAPERPPDAAAHSTGLKRKRFSEEDQDDFDKLDGIFKRIKKNVPESPYILSTPSMFPYLHRSHHEAHAWMMGRLFRPNEEHLQYRTYLFREPYQDCFTLQPGEDHEPEPPRPSSKPAATSSSTPSGQAPKKKINFSDYKSKQANGVITPGSKKPSPNLLPVKPPPVQANGAKLPPEKKPPSSARKPDAPKIHNRYVEPDAPSQSVLILHDRVPSASTLPDKPKKQAQPPPSTAPPARPQKPEPTEPKPTLDKSDPSNSTPHGLPPLLSPVDPPLSNPYGLPPILSPTLPTVITEELKKQEIQRDRASSNASASSSDPKSQLLNVPEPGLQKLKSEPKNVVRERYVSMSTKSPAKSPNTKPPEPTEETQKLVVKLKYGKKQRDNIKRILKLPPRPEKKEREEAPKDRPVHAQKKPVSSAPSNPKTASKTAPRRPETSTDSINHKAPAAVGAKVAQKRPRPDDDGVQPTASKRPRASSIQETPNTPKEQLVPSSTLPSKPGAQKSSQGLQVTPRKDKGVNMLRTASAESYDSTPGKGTASAAPKHLEVKAPSSAPLNNKKQADISLLQHASMKMNTMGRSFKHEGQKLEREKLGKKEDQKLAAVIGLECIL